MFKVPSVVHIGQADPNFPDKFERKWSVANDDSTFCHFASFTNDVNDRNIESNRRNASFNA